MMVIVVLVYLLSIIADLVIDYNYKKLSVSVVCIVNIKVFRKRLHLLYVFFYLKLVDNNLNLTVHNIKQLIGPAERKCNARHTHTFLNCTSR